MRLVLLILALGCCLAGLARAAEPGADPDRPYRHALEFSPLSTVIRI